MPTLRLLTYNVRSLRDDEAAVARIIRAAEPHVVCIQEAPRFLRWRARCAALARRSGLVIVGGGRTAAANLILSTLGVEQLGTWDVLLSKEPNMHQRGSAVAELRLSGARFALAGVHLDVEAEPRVRHVAELHAAIDERISREVPLIVAGDVNDDPGSPVYSALGGRGVDVWGALGSGDGSTTTRDDPPRRIDAVFADPRITPRSATVIRTPDVLIASDHHPLLVELEI